DDIRQSRPRGRDDDSGPAGDEEVPIGAVAGRLLVPGSHGPDPELRQVPVELEVVRAGDAEDRVDAMGGQSGHDGTTAVAEALGPIHRRTPRASPAGPVGSAEPFFSAAHSDRIS